MTKKQLKITIDHEITKAFKAACKANKVSMTKELSEFMVKRANILNHSANTQQTRLDNRGGRRKEFADLISRIEAIREAEDEYKNRIPINLRNGPAYDSAENAVDMLDQAIGLLYEVFG